MTCIRCDGTTIITIEQRATMSKLTVTCTNCITVNKYAGIGSRETPPDICAKMSNAAMRLGLLGWGLRSGLAPGADQAFAAGCDIVGGKKIVRCITDSEAAKSHAAHFHPNWDACSEHVKGLHARNSLIMLGDWLDDPVKFVVCWTPSGLARGGTGQALRIAAAYDIPVFNLAEGPIDELWEWLS